MIIDESTDSDAEERAPQNAAADVAGTAYRESITSVDGFTRGLNGRIKFNKDTKKRRREDDTNQDVEMAEVDELAPGNRSKKPKKKTDPKFGHEFKAKVRSNIIFFGDQSPTLILESWWRCQEGRSRSICLYVPFTSSQKWGAGS
jgi:ribosomal RNA-processing protein 12